MSDTQRSILDHLTAEDAVGQLRRRDSKMATRGSENRSVKLDWVDSFEHVSANPSLLEPVEAEATDLWQQGIRHIIRADMGGSIITARVLTHLGFCDGTTEHAEASIQRLLHTTAHHIADQPG